MKKIFHRKNFERNLKFTLLISSSLVVFQLLVQPFLLCYGVNNCEAYGQPIPTIFYILLFLPFSIGVVFIIYAVAKRMGLKYRPNFNLILVFAFSLLVYNYVGVVNSYIILKEDKITIKSSKYFLSSVFLHSPYGLTELEISDIDHIEQRWTHAGGRYDLYQCKPQDYFVLKSGQKMFFDFGLIYGMSYKIRDKYSTPIVRTNDGSSGCVLKFKHEGY